MNKEQKLSRSNFGTTAVGTKALSHVVKCLQGPGTATALADNSLTLF